MKRIFLSALLGVGMTAAIFQVSSGSSSARTPEDYPLVCRGGGSLVIGINRAELKRCGLLKKIEKETPMIQIKPQVRP